MKNPIKELDDAFHCYVDNSGLPRRKLKVRTTTQRITEACIKLERHLSDAYATMPQASKASMYRMIDECSKLCIKLFSTSYDYLWTQDFIIVFDKKGTFSGVKLAKESYDNLLLLDQTD